MGQDRSLSVGGIYHACHTVLIKGCFNFPLFWSAVAAIVLRFGSFRVCPLTTPTR